ncbi:MAG TPA: hypothetical protein VH253_04770 [Phycisphaerae bacterium]|nr:hypothetical protein [Phycisphaerae bacterium]
MAESSSSPPPSLSAGRSGPGMPVERTPEQHDAVRRRSAPIAFGGVLCGAAGLAMLFTRPISHLTPPNVYALNLSFCAMLIGLGILFYARGTPGTRIAVTLSIVALLSGGVGPLIFARQSIAWHIAMEAKERQNVSRIAEAAYRWALDHGGHYPATLQEMVDGKLLTPDDLHSPFGNSDAMDQRRKLSPADFDKWYATHSDYSYFGGDLDLHAALRVVGPATAPAAGDMAAATAAATRAAFPALAQLPDDLIIAASYDVIMSTHMSASFMDGRADFLDLEKAEAALKATNAEREKMGLPDIRPPGAVERAREEERQDATPSP